MSQLQLRTARKFSPFLLTIAFAALVGSAALSLKPDLTKPIFMKYYRALYKVEAVRPL